MPESLFSSCSSILSPSQGFKKQWLTLYFKSEKKKKIPEANNIHRHWNVSHMKSFCVVTEWKRWKTYKFTQKLKFLKFSLGDGAFWSLKASIQFHRRKKDGFRMTCNVLFLLLLLLLLLKINQVYYSDFKSQL